MTAPVIQFKRGALSNLPGLRAGEPAFTTDTYDLYVGLTSATGTNKFFGSHRYWSKETTSVGSGINVVEGTSNGSSYITIKSPDSLSGIVTYTLPGTDGSNGNVLVTDGSGNLSFSSSAFITASSTDTLTNKTFDANGTGNSISNIEVADFAAAAIVIESEGIDSNDNDTTIPTSAAVKDYVDNNSPATSLDISGDTGTASVSTGSTFAFTGTDPVVIAASGAGVTFSISDASTSSKGIASFDSNDFGVSSGAVSLNDAVVKSVSTDSGAATPSGHAFTVAGTANEIETSGSSATVTIGLPAAVTVTTSVTTPTVKATNLQANDGTTAITITDSTGAVACNQNLTVQGNLVVNGSTTQVNTSQTTIEDQLLELGMVDGSAPSSDLNKDIGVIFNYYTSVAKKAAVYWDDSTSRVVVSQDVSESSGVLTNNTSGALEVASLYVNGCTGSAVEVIGCSGGEVVITNATIDGGSF